ncbi:MAG TPA: abortive infection family protein [Iamia sp.]
MTPTSGGRRLSMAAVELATELFARQYGLSGPEIHSVFAPFTDVLGPYPMEDKPSRWKIFQRGLEALTTDDQQRLLTDLLEREWPALDAAELDKLREMLASGAQISSRQLGERVDLLNWAGVERSWRDALDLVARNPDGAIRAARTTLESVCKHVCDERNAEYPAGGDLPKLYKAAASALTLAPDQHSEQVIKQVLSGAATVVGGLAAMRNALSDAHGAGKVHVRPGPRHARLAVNMAFGLATFLIDTHMEKAAGTTP